MLNMYTVGNAIHSNSQTFLFWPPLLLLETGQCSFLAVCFCCCKLFHWKLYLYINIYLCTCLHTYLFRWKFLRNKRHVARKIGQFKYKLHPREFAKRTAKSGQTQFR